MIIFERSYLRIHWVAEGGFVRMEWLAGPRNQEFQEGLNRGLELVIAENAKHWLADMRKMGAFSPEDEHWANNDWFPRAIRAGITHMALIVPTSLLTKMSVESIMSKVPNTQLTTAYFDTVEKATEWLRKP